MVKFTPLTLVGFRAVYVFGKWKTGMKKNVELGMWWDKISPALTRGVKFVESEDVCPLPAGPEPLWSIKAVWIRGYL